MIDLAPEPPVSDVPVTYPQGVAISLREDEASVPASPPAVPLRATRPRQSSMRQTLSTWAWTAAAILGFAVGGWNLWHAATSLHATTATVKTTPAARELITKPIETLRPGMRVLADNPELAGDPLPDLDIDPQTHRLLTYRLVRPDGSSVEWDRIEPAMEMAAELVTTLPDNADVLPRPFAGSATDVLLQELLVGGQIDIDLPELGATGAATIIAVRPCPPIEPNDGTGRRLITSVYRHTAKTVYDVEIAGQPPIGATGNHPFWSEDRQAFVRADELRNGERLRQADGSTATVAAVTQRPDPTPVYNIEVDAEHVYYVGKHGALVHNATCILANAAKGRAAEMALGIVKNFKHVDSVTGRRAFRVPDVLDARVIGEVKHVRSLRFGSQLQDYLYEAMESGKKMVVYIRKGDGTTLSPALKRLEAAGFIEFRRLIDPGL